MDSLLSLVSGVYNLFISAPAQTISTNSINQELIHAVKGRDIPGVTAALAKGIPVDSVDDNGRTALMIAASNGHRVITTILLEEGADHSLEDEQGFTALELAICFGKTEIAKILLENGAFFDAAMLNNLLTMDEAHPAAITIFKLSLQNSCSLDLDSALKTAFDNEDIKLISLLKQNGAKPSFIQLPEDDLRVAARKGLVKKAQMLLEIGFPIDNQEVHCGHTALIWSIKKGHLNIAKLLVDNGANIALRNFHDESPFMLCASKSRGNTKYLNFCHQLLDNMTFEQIQASNLNDQCTAIIKPYMQKNMKNLQEKVLYFLCGAPLPFELKQQILSLMSNSKWGMPVMLHAQQTILDIIAERGKLPAMIFSSSTPSNYQPDSMKVDIEEKAAPKKKDRSVLL